jgi:MerR family transcriptional regulator, thiopeptide resistance regulator
MAYTVRKLAGLSGVSVRTLHFYDAVGLLKPAYHGANGYRFYEEPQLLMLQQILFYRELGFELKRIKEILQRSDFDKIAALESHRKVLRRNLARTRELLVTIEKTIEHLKGAKEMKSKELFVGFTPEQQARHENYLAERFGACAGDVIAQSKRKVKGWTKNDWAKSKTAFDEICHDFVTMLRRQAPSDSSALQDVIRRHYNWMKQFWKPGRKSYIGYSQLVLDSELRKAYEGHHPRLPEFAAAAMKVFAESELQ